MLLFKKLQYQDLYTTSKLLSFERGGGGFIQQAVSVGIKLLDVKRTDIQNDQISVAVIQWIFGKAMWLRFVINPILCKRT